jgi:hypothetical protein
MAFERKSKNKLSSENLAGSELDGIVELGDHQVGSIAGGQYGPPNAPAPTPSPTPAPTPGYPSWGPPLPNSPAWGPYPS